MHSLKKNKTKKVLHLHAEWKGAQHHRQELQLAGIPLPSENQDSGFTEKKLKETLIPSPFSLAMGAIYHDTLYLAECLRQKG